MHVLVAASFAGPWAGAGSAMPNPGNGVPVFVKGGSVMIFGGSGVVINNTRCHNQNAFMVAHKASNLAAAKAGQWTDVPITIELAGLSAEERAKYDPNDLCVNWEDHHPYQDARGNVSD